MSCEPQTIIIICIWHIWQIKKRWFSPSSSYFCTKLAHGIAQLELDIWNRFSIGSIINTRTVQEFATIQHCIIIYNSASLWLIIWLYAWMLYQLENIMVLPLLYIIIILLYTVLLITLMHERTVVCML